MKLLITIKDEDIFPKDYVLNAEDDSLMAEERIAVKFLIFDNENKLALVGTKNRLLPGGGVENNESLVEAVKRECLEEVGCDVEVIEEIGFSEEWRNHKKRRHQINHCFIGKVIGEKGIPETIQEDELGIEVDWVTLEDAIRIVEKQVETIPFEAYHSCFNVRVHLAFLKEYKENYADRS